MVSATKLKKLKEEFSFLRERVLGVLLFGSNVDNNATSRSDIDICIVAPKQKPNKVLSTIYRNIDAYAKRYDVYTFEELPLYMKAEVLRNHKVIVAKDLPELYEYFYFYRKLWDEQKHRQEISKEEILGGIDKQVIV